MSEALISIAATEAMHACKDEPDLIERIRKAMRACHDHWLVTDERLQFMAALAAAHQASEGAERDRLERSSKAVNRVSAMLSALQAGVPVDVEAMSAEKPDDDLIPLNKMWHEIAQ